MAERILSTTNIVPRMWTQTILFSARRGHLRSNTNVPISSGFSKCPPPPGDQIALRSVQSVGSAFMQVMVIGVSNVDRENKIFQSIHPETQHNWTSCRARASCRLALVCWNNALHFYCWNSSRTHMSTFNTSSTDTRSSRES